MVQGKRRSQRGHQGAEPLAETDRSGNLDVDPIPLLQHSSPPLTVTALMSPGLDIRGQGQKRPAQSSITPPKKKRTNPTRSPPLTNQENSKSPDHNDTHARPNRTSPRLLQNSQPSCSSSPVDLEEPVSARSRSARQSQKGTVQCTDAHPAKMHTPSLPPLSTSPVSNTTGKKLAASGKKQAASGSSQMEAVAQKNKKKSPSTSPLEKSISLILSTEGNRPPTRRSHKRKRMHGNPKTMPPAPTQQHSKKSTPLVDRSHPVVAQVVTSAPSIPSTQSSSTPPCVECISPRAVATGSNISPRLSQARPSASITSPPYSKSKRRSTALPVAAPTTDAVVPRRRFKQEMVSSPQPSPVTMGRLKQEVVVPASHPCSSPCQLVVDDIHNCDLVLIIQPQSGATSPATSYYCRVCNGRLVLTDTGHRAHSSTPLVSCDNDGTGTVKKSLKIPCVFCDDLLSSRGALYRHIKTSHRHKLSKKPYYCSICRKWYETSIRLWRHLHIHLDVGPTRGRCIKQKTPTCALVQKKATKQPPSLGR